MIADTPTGADAGFDDLDAYLRLPRLSGLTMSLDGKRLVVAVATPNRKGNRFVTALWGVDPEGVLSARRLTRGSTGERNAKFMPSGDLLFATTRPDPDGDDDTAGEPSLWVLPVRGGEARLVAHLPGGAEGITVARESGHILLGSNMMPSAVDPAGDKEIRAKRKDAKVTAILHEQYPVRFWDHDLGPDRTRLLVADAEFDFRDITGNAPGAFYDESTWDISADGRTVVASWMVPEGRGSWRNTLVAIDVATGERRVLADDPDFEYEGPQISPDGTRVAMAVRRRCTPQLSDKLWLGVVPLAGGKVEALTGDWDRWPHAGRWTPDGSALVIGADDQGHAPLWRVDATTGERTKLTETGAYSDIQVSPDGRWVYALRSSVDAPPAPVRIALEGPPSVTALLGPADTLGRAVPAPGKLTEVTTTAADGAPLRAWLALPNDADAASPAPLLLWIHGGPLASWNSWQWRWNPWLAVARGYAVLLPDPALSTGYGTDFVQRGWHGWGGVPFTDLMSITDGALARDDLDSDRTAAMGGSFGGYMSNWVAGHTKRFQAIVTHASVWALDQFGPTTDAAFYWYRELDPELNDENSPHNWVDEISTPMLVIHGDKDYRVPIGEGIRLWWDLMSRTENGTGPHKFLYFPDENHWILTPNHIKVWYSTIFAFLAHHVLGKDWERPDMLG